MLLLAMPALRLAPRWLARLALLTLALSSSVTAQEPAPAPFSAEQLEQFEKHVRPVLVKHCQECHGPDKQESGLRLDSRAAVLLGGDDGAAIVPGKPDESRLLKALRHEQDPKMPPDGKLPPADVDALTAWVAAGAAWPTEETKANAAELIAAKAAAHWAFKKVVEPALPEQTAWALQPLDRFIQAKLAGAGLEPSRPADRRTFLRRAALDVVGLPPTADDVSAFERDMSATAYETAIDRLLASPQYGERWARHWLDVARYADTRGYVFTEDRNYPQAFAYRDWVVKALNEDKPYDQFLIEQIAADRLCEQRDVEHLAPLGFLTLGRRFINNKHDIIDDRMDVICRGALALTVTCARCHDHKYDPIPTADYYALYGVLDSCEEKKLEGGLTYLLDAPQPREPRVFLRGNPGNAGPATPRQMLSVISGQQRKPFADGSGRLELAKAIASGDNPLTARVIVNRVWGYHFGKGLVSTPSDFGVRSDPPTHPELLDYLAARLVADGWSLKKLHRTILLSATYRQASDRDGAREAIDLENRLLWRMNRKRLDFEGLRDSLLAASGTLDATMGGPGVEITVAPYPKRRTLYARIERQNLPGLFRTFDFASPDMHAPQRYQTTAPQQSLFLMNNPFMVEQAQALATRGEEASGGEQAQRIERIYLAALGRKPSARELGIAQAYLQAEADTAADSTRSSVWHYGYGQYDESSQRVATYADFPVYDSNRWGGKQLPDAELQFAHLNPQGGHPGVDVTHSVIRRWVSPTSGVVSVRGRLAHPAETGDGITARVVHGRHGQAGQWKVRHAEIETYVERIKVAANDTLDFVVECNATHDNDSFTWSVVVREADRADAPPWDSAADFAGPQPPRIDVWTRFAQALLMSNEFVFVD